jgi:hemoglobin
MSKPDLDNAAAISSLVELFYTRVLTDPLLAPLFTQVARIDPDAHLPTIKAFWRKMLLGDPAYARNMVARHGAVHARVAFEARHFDRWLALFTHTLEHNFAGPYTERARTLATRMAANLQRNLDAYTAAQGRSEVPGPPP